MTTPAGALTPTASSSAARSRRAGHVLRWIGLGLVVATIGSAAGFVLLRAQVKPLPTFGVVPDFQLTAADGQPFGTANLDGKPWVADFVFTSCPDVCPLMTQRMSQLQTWLVEHHLSKRVHLVSISVDPARDTPAVLQTYAAAAHARPELWSFLTGPQDKIEDAVVHGFKQAMSREKDDSQDGFAILHGTKLVLVDHKRQIRGYYDSDDARSLESLRHDVGALADGAN